MNAFSWSALPNEMKVAVADRLGLEDLKHLSSVDSTTRGLCVPSIFQVVQVKDSGRLAQYLAEVPNAYLRYLRALKIQTTPVAYQNQIVSATDMLVQLLNQCVLLETLELRIANGLGHQIIPSFRHLAHLRNLTVANCGDEVVAPLSERLAVSIAASVPNLEHLYLDRVARSAMHSPELVGSYPYVPLVVGDASIPTHPTLGTALSLPSLLSIPSLRTLRIRDTHLGDPCWSTAPIACTSLALLDLSGCPSQTSAFNALCTQRILAQVGPSLSHFSLHAPLSFPSSSPSHGGAASATTPEGGKTPINLTRLRHVHLTPLFPVSGVVETLTTLARAGSPVEQLSVQCYEDDAVDMCEALEDFLSARAESGAYPQLTAINVRFDGGLEEASLVPGGEGEDTEERAARAVAARRLLEYCQDLQVSGCIEKLAAEGGATTRECTVPAKVALDAAKLIACY